MAGYILVKDGFYKNNMHDSWKRFFLYPFERNEIDTPALKTKMPGKGKPTDDWEEVNPEDYDVYFNGPDSPHPGHTYIYVKVYKLKGNDPTYEYDNMRYLLGEIYNKKILPEKQGRLAENLKTFADMADASTYVYNAQSDAAANCRNNESCSMMGGSRKKRGQKTRQNKKRRGKKQKSRRRT